MPEIIPHAGQGSNDTGIVRIAIADGYAMFRAALRKLLESEPSFRVVGEASDGIEAADIVRQRRPHILLLEIALPRRTGLEALREIYRSPPLTRPLLLVATVSDAQLMEALLLGAYGLVLKTAATALLLKGIRAVMAGEYWLERDRVSHLIRALRDCRNGDRQDAHPNSFKLTTRELEIIAASAGGYGTRDIAQKLSLSEVTIKHHFTAIFRKLGVCSRVELATFAMSHSLVGDGSPASASLMQAGTDG
jgi:two-component system, NarL family, nitrate/nitrite response regulator NarL